MEADTEPPSKPPAERAELDARGAERPRFLLGFPDDPELQALVQAFEAGNFARVRREAPGLAERARDPEVRRAAAELRRRIDPDPLLLLLLGLCCALFVFVVVWTYAR